MLQVKSRIITLQILKRATEILIQMSYTHNSDKEAMNLNTI